MKHFLSFLLLISTFSVSAQRGGTIDDLSQIDINIQDSITAGHDIHHPNHHNSSRIYGIDCLMLDVIGKVSLRDKMKLAQALRLTHGFRRERDHSLDLDAQVKGHNVIFPMTSGHVYMTFIWVQSRDGRSLHDTIKENVTSVAITPYTKVSLVYVRGCRF